MIVILLLEVRNLKKYNKIYNKNNNNSSNSNNNENNNNNKSSNDNKVNSTPPSPTSKETVFILGDSMVKKLNGFLLTRKLNHKCLVKVRPFNSPKVRCMHDHAKLFEILTRTTLYYIVGLMT